MNNRHPSLWPCNGKKSLKERERPVQRNTVSRCVYVCRHFYDGGTTRLTMIRGTKSGNILFRRFIGTDDILILGVRKKNKH